jgi:WD40 repeat protein
VWRADTGAPIAELKGHEKEIVSAVFSPDGTRVVTASSDNTARIWMSDTGALVAVLTGHAYRVNSARFSPDGTRVVTASDDETARVWHFEAVPGDASVLPLWVEVLSGTEHNGVAIRPLSLDEWKQRKAELQAKGSLAPPGDWRTIGTAKTQTY